MTGFITTLLIAVVMMCLVPQTGAKVYSEEGTPAMNLGAGMLAQNVNKSNAQTV